MPEQIEPMINKDQAIAEIGGIMHQVSVMGFNDSEIPTLMRLMDDVKTGKINPEEALTEAHSILDRKQDYH